MSAARMRIAAWALCAAFVILAIIAMQTLDAQWFIASLLAQAAMILAASASDRKKPDCEDRS